MINEIINAPIVIEEDYNRPTGSCDTGNFVKTASTIRCMMQDAYANGVIKSLIRKGQIERVAMYDLRLWVDLHTSSKGLKAEVHTRQTRSTIN
jgi:hypothetical protein